MSARHASFFLSSLLLGCSSTAPVPTHEAEQHTALSDRATDVFAEDRFVEVNGAKLHYVDWGGDGPPLRVLVLCNDL